MTTGGSKIVRSPTRATIDWKVDRSPISGMNCFGRLSRDSGHTRVPEPPHIITGWILFINWPLVAPRRSNQRVFCVKVSTEATPVLHPCRSARTVPWRRKGDHSGGRRGERQRKGGEGGRKRETLRDRAGREGGRQSGQCAEQGCGGEADGRQQRGLARRRGEAAGHDGAGADPDQGEAGDAKHEASPRGHHRKSGGGDGEGYDDDPLVADPQTDD